MSMPTQFTIAGGGIAGLTAALSLARHGLAAHVHEKAISFEEVGAGIQLAPNAMHILAALGLADALATCAVAPSSIEIGSGVSRRPIGSVPLGPSAQERYGAPYLVVHRADLQRILVEACSAHELVTMSLASDLAPGDIEGPVIAADGVHSAWRGAVRGQQSHKHFTGYVAWRTTVQQALEDKAQLTRVWMGPGAHLVEYPISAGEAQNLVAIARADDPRPIRADPYKLLARAFARWDDKLQALLNGQDGWTPWPLFSVAPDEPWVSERVALIGDAAHAMLPFAAQGGAMAIEDAWVLAELLSHSSQLDQAFERYEKARKARVVRVWNEAKRNGSIYHLTGPLAFARDAVIKARSGPNLLARYDWLYGWRASGT